MSLFFSSFLLLYYVQRTVKDESGCYTITEITEITEIEPLLKPQLEHMCPYEVGSMGDIAS